MKTLKSLLLEMDAGDVDSEFPRPGHSNQDFPKAFNATPEELDNVLETVLSVVISLGLYDKVKQEVIRLKTRYPDMKNQDNKTLSTIQKFKNDYDKDIKHPGPPDPDEDGPSAEQERGWDDAEDSFRSGKP